MTTSCSTGRNGLPVATSARPSVHRIRSTGTASAFDVGLDSGMMTARSTGDAICRTMPSVNAPNWVEVPISIVGFAFATTSARPIGPSCCRDQLATSAAGRAYGSWKSRNAAESSVRSPRLSTVQNLPVASCSGEPVRDHHLADHVGDADSGGPSTMDHHPLVAPRLPVVLAAANAAARTTAGGPCLSSLNVHTSDAYLFRMRRAFPAPKSSQCNMACGNSL